MLKFLMGLAMQVPAVYCFFQYSELFGAAWVIAGFVCVIVGFLIWGIVKGAGEALDTIGDICD